MRVSEYSLLNKDGRQGQLPQKESQNILIAPCWLAAVWVINPSPSMILMGQTKNSKKTSNKYSSKMVSLIFGHCCHAYVCSSDKFNRKFGLN